MSTINNISDTKEKEAEAPTKKMVFYSL